MCANIFYIGCNYYFYSQYFLNHLESFLSVVRPLTGFTFQLFPFDVYKSLKIFSVVVWKIVLFQSEVYKVAHIWYLATIPVLSPFFFPPKVTILCVLCFLLCFKKWQQMCVLYVLAPCSLDSISSYSLLSSSKDLISLLSVALLLFKDSHHSCLALCF